MIGGSPQDLAAWAPPGKPRRRAGRVIFWLLVALSAALVVGGIGLAVKTMHQFYEPPQGKGMSNTVQPGDRVFVALGTNIRRGDIVVASMPPAARGAGGLVVKRVIGLPGDHVACCDANGRVTVNGKAIDETYLDPAGPPSRFSFSVTLGPGQTWMMGDNRNVSYDSRGFGPVPQSAITGRVVAVVRNFSAPTVRTPPTFVASGLAPPDRRLSPLVLVSALISAGIVGLLILAIVGIIRFAIRRSRAKRDRPPGYSPYGTMAD
jgi:signal peptidase I